MLIHNKKAIGIFGGSFDPPHKGHVEISKISLKKIKLKKIYWVVTKKNPFKKKSFYSLSRRITLAKKLSIKNKFIKVIFVENKCKSNRTHKYINYLSKKYINNDFYFIMGADNLINFHKWKSWKEIPKICKILVFDRENYRTKCLKSVAYKKIDRKRLKFIKFNKVNISSSQLRKI
mgnify:CR=1 FL=1